MSSKGFWQSMTGWMGGDHTESPAPSREPDSPAIAGEGASQEVRPEGSPFPLLRSESDRPSQPDPPMPAPAYEPAREIPQHPGPRPIGGSDGPNQETRQKVIDVIKSCYDPEIPVNIYELGLIYSVVVEPADHAQITMTLTAPNCPAAQSLPAEVKRKTEALDEIGTANVEIVFDPPWTPNQMSDAAKLALNIL